jgi:acetyl esterase/lipase
MAPIWTFQPFKGLLTVLVIIISPLYFSILSIYYIPKGLRPHPNWSWHTSLGRAFYFLMFRYATAVRMAPDYAVTAGSLNERFVMAKPASSDKYTGILDHPSIKPIPFGAIWFPNAPTAEDIHTRKFVLHLPGGAYVIASPPSTTGVFPSSVFSKKINAITFYAQYRVAATPDTRFPAAIQDAVTFYAYLLDLGIPAKNIIVSGDSAGGNLVIALLRYIEENKGLPKPCGAISWSPWVNVTPSAISAYKGSASNSTDLVPWQILEWGLGAYPPPSSESSSSEVQAYVSPAQHPFSTGTPLLVQAGSAEVFLQDIQAFAKDMARIEGNQVKYCETLHAPHDLILCGKILGMVKETEDVVEAAKGFFNI